MSDQLQFADLVGKTLVKVEINPDRDRMTLNTADEAFVLWHSQDCCESVSIEDVCGDLDDLIGAPVLLAEEASNSDEVKVDPAWPDYRDESFTWTFYKLATIKGAVTIRWYGSSSGYYSESVDFARLGAAE